MVNYMDMKLFSFCCLMGAGALMASCSSDNDAQPSGEGTISLNVTAETGFQSRALSEADYQNLNNYTVQLIKESQVLNTWNYADLPSAVKVDAGSYQVKAFYGEDQPASRESMYVEGVTDVTVNPSSGENATPQTVSVTCKPVCAKVNVKFADSMSEYFSDYYVTFKTAALGDGTFVWSKTDTDPVYLKVSQNESVSVSISTTRTSGGSPSVVNKTYVMSPQTGLTINVSPTAPDAEGDIQISVEIDTTTVDHEQNIEVPNDWI